MMWLPAAFSSAIIFGIGGFLFRVSNQKSYAMPSVLLGLYSTGALVFLYALMQTTTFEINPLVILFSILIGLGSYYGNTFLAKAYDTGPSSLTSPLMSINIVLVVAMSAFIYHESITLTQWIGITCTIISVALLSIKNNNNQLITSRLWGMFIILAILFVFMREGGLKIAHEHGVNGYEILFFGYLIGVALSLFNLRTIEWPSLFLGSTIGFFSGIGMGLLAYAIAKGPASVIIPIFSSRNFVSMALMVAFLKERPSRLQWLAITILMIGIFLISSHE